ncbi:hypothetical protein M426DRAFT_15314 [Hypoxylon sp. CI-4A]|nr:hypothetical protein M426DRAFT_15314 [Hypoxylon sp. CI-4A]
MAQQSPPCISPYSESNTDSISVRSLSQSSISRRDDGYDALVDIMAEMRTQGVTIEPVVRNLILQLYDTTKAAEERGDRISNKHVHLQAKHACLVVEFNKYCNNGEAWQSRTERALFNDMVKSADAANATTQRAHEVNQNMLVEYLEMTNEVVALRREVAAQRERFGWGEGGE